MTLSYKDIIDEFVRKVPKNRTHMFCWFVTEADRGRIHPLVHGIATALHVIDAAESGYALKILGRISSIHGIGRKQLEQLIEILGEIYVTEGAAMAADRDSIGKVMFQSEPGARAGKNPDLEYRWQDNWIGIEVKTPALSEFQVLRQRLGLQLVTRLPNKLTTAPIGELTYPRDNPIKDFLVSAEQKFKVYAQGRPDAWRILTVVWDDFCNEPISALANPLAGLFTERSFYYKNDISIKFNHIDGVVICRYYHQLANLTKNVPIIDGGAVPLQYYQPGFPYKAFVQNPHGRHVPRSIIAALNAEIAEELATVAAEYNSTDIVVWVPRPTSK